MKNSKTGYRKLACYIVAALAEKPRGMTLSQLKSFISKEYCVPMYKITRSIKNAVQKGVRFGALEAKGKKIQMGSVLCYGCFNSTLDHLKLVDSKSYLKNDVTNCKEDCKFNAKPMKYRQYNRGEDSDTPESRRGGSDMEYEPTLGSSVSLLNCPTCGGNFK